MAPRLDEAGRCVLTDLKPAECGCKDHRNSPDVKALNLGEFQVAQMTDARYDGRCALDPRHKIKHGDEISLITPLAGGEPLGWVCDACAAAVANG